MALQILRQNFKSSYFFRTRTVGLITKNVVTKASGAVLPEPAKVPFGLIGIFGAVVPGLLIGATISKNIANFLEENELFVPTDDDDDDD